MSKSLGNYFTLRDLIAKGCDPLDLRYALMSGHYTSVLNFTFDGLAAAAKARARVQDLIYSVWDAQGTDSFDAAALRASVFSALADNLHTPKALAALFSGIATMKASTLDAHSRAAVLDFFRELNGVFAVWTIGAAPAKEQLAIPDDVKQLAQQRWEAKQARNFTEADALRAEIAAAGWVMKDRKDGWDLEPASAS